MYDDTRTESISTSNLFHVLLLLYNRLILTHHAHNQRDISAFNLPFLHPSRSPTSQASPLAKGEKNKEPKKFKHPGGCRYKLT